MKLLLDTHAFLWLASGSPEASLCAREAYLDTNNQLYLSAASVWEIAIKYSLGRLGLPRKPEVYIPEVRKEGDIEELVVDEASALYVNRLPLIHRDPFDRLLIAQATVHEMTLLTSDEAIEQYGVKTLW